MEISSALLVALMFVGLLSIGIGNILMGLTAVFDNRSELKVDWLHASWMILLLLVCFELFWHTVELFSVEDWRFGGFLYIVLGPILIAFAGQVLLPDLSRPESRDLRAHYLKVSREFFFLFALVEAWIIGVDLVLGKGLTTVSGTNAAAVILLSALAFSRRAGIHRLGAIAAWVLFLSSVALQTSASSA